jgi:hypothetical protein
MRTPWCLLTTIALLGSAVNNISFPDGGWGGGSAMFTGRAGSVRLPPGFTSRHRRTLHFQGRTHRERNPSYLNERIVDGARAWTSTKDRPLPNGRHTFRFAVTFPDCECANFFLDSSKPDRDLEEVTLYARFRRAQRSKRKA